MGVVKDKIWSLPSDCFKELVKNSKTIGDILKFFGLKNKGSCNYNVRRRIELEDIDISHITLGKGSNKGKKIPPHKQKPTIPIDEILIENCKHKNVVKYRIIKDKILDYKCKECGLSDSWNGKKLTLELEHINGINNDNRIENLCFLCPNCHSQTRTYCGKNKKNNKNAPYASQV